MTLNSQHHRVTRPSDLIDHMLHHSRLHLQEQFLAQSKPHHVNGGAASSDQRGAQWQLRK